MKFRFTILAALCLPLMLGAQSAEEWEKQLETAGTKEETMRICYELGDAYRGPDPEKSLQYAKRAHQLALDLADKGMAARSAYLTALTYERQRDKRNMEVWLKSAAAYARQAGDIDLIVRSVDKRGRLAVSERKEERAIRIYREAFEYFSQNGTSISELQQKYEMEKRRIALEKNQIELEKAELEQEWLQLRQDVLSLLEEKAELTKDRRELLSRQEDLLEEKKEIELQVDLRESAIDSLAQVKQRAEAEARKAKEEVQLREARYEQLSKKALEQELMLRDAQLETAQQQNLIRLAGLALAFLVLLALMYYSRYRSNRRAKKELEKKNRIIDEERRRSDELLLNILPGPIAQELKSYGKANARRYEEVTVLFTDFKNFSRISQQLTPEELVDELDECFKAFDFIIRQYPEIEKIKTIGDAYMCASGLSERKVLPVSILQAALEMQEFLEDHKQEKIRQGKPYFEARIGLHTGPVVAGVVGTKKFAYDIWGDTVNTAARMESECQEGRVNISETTYNLVKYQFDCEPRGEVQVKHKGGIHMYFVDQYVGAVAT